WRSTEHPYALDARWLPLASTARRMEYSTMSYAAAIALGHAIRYVTAMPLEEVAAHNAELASQIAGELTQRGAKLLTPADPARRAGAGTQQVPPRGREAVAAPPTPPAGV